MASLPAGSRPHPETTHEWNVSHVIQIYNDYISSESLPPVASNMVDLSDEGIHWLVTKAGITSGQVINQETRFFGRFFEDDINRKSQETLIICALSYGRVDIVSAAMTAPSVHDLIPPMIIDSLIADNSRLPTLIEFLDPTDGGENSGRSLTTMGQNEIGGEIFGLGQVGSTARIMKPCF
jgi:hypothetical protein